jgi:hypothetical protein
MEETEKKTFNCQYCNKLFNSYMGYWKHNKNKHILNKKLNISNNKEPELEPELDLTLPNNYCKYCKKEFLNSKNRWRHEKKNCSINKKIKKSIIKSNNINKKNDNNQQIINVKNNNNQQIINVENNNSIDIEYSYIYLIQKYDVNLKEDLYKFGKTNRKFTERIKEHGKESKVLIILDVKNCSKVEINILNILRNDNKINERKNIGNEYFNCDDKQYIINLILKNVCN